MTTQRRNFSEKLSDQLTQLETLVGNTPLYAIRNVYKKPGLRISAKLEWMQLGGSVKTRPAYYIIKDAIRRGLIDYKKSLLDASSGNTGISYAAIAAALNIPVTLCIPENASTERKSMLQAYGAQIIYTSKFESTDGAQQKAKEMVERFPEQYYYADQYNNDNNWYAHYATTAEEIWEQTQGKITHFIAGLGTTGTFTGTAKRLKELNPAIEVIALQPNNPMHSLEGWKHLETAKVPGIYNHQLADKIIEVDTLEAFDLVKKTAAAEGLLISPSAAANLLGAIQVADSLDQGYIVTTFADSSEKYGDVYREIFK